MAKRFLPAALCLAIAILSLKLAPPIEAKNRENLELAAAFQLPELPKLPGLGGASADWRQWDSFFTFIVKRVGQDVGGDLRDSLGEAFLDSRYELTATVARLGGGQNPVPQLFLNGWRRLSPVMNKALPALSQQSAERYRNFIVAIDKLAAVGQQGSRLGLLQISPDILRSMARILQPRGFGDPIAYNLNIDGGLRNLIGLDAPRGVRPPVRKQSGLRGLPFPMNGEQASVGIAFAAEINLKKLNQWVPEENELQSYLLEVRNLLAALGDRVGAKSEIAEQHRTLYRQIVLTAAWQESCWRQFIKKGKAVIPLASASGDLGLMQVNRNTWRNIYDLKRLGGDIEYNGNAGGEILAYYLSRHRDQEK